MTDLERVRPAAVDPGKYDLIKRTITPGLSDDEFELFVAAANRTGLDPINHQIWGIKRKDRLIIQVGIDGLRLVAERSGAYAGQEPVEWFDPETRAWADVWLSDKPPAAARACVLKASANYAATLSRYPATVTWREFAPDTKKPEGFMWAQMPAFMLAKVAEAHALRKAFPADLSGIYTAEEMDQASPPASAPGELPPPAGGPDLVTRVAYDQVTAEAAAWSSFARNLLNDAIDDLRPEQREWLKEWTKTHPGPDGHPWPNLHNPRAFTPDHAPILAEWVAMAASYAPPGEHPPGEQG